MTQTPRDQLVETLRHTMVTLVARSEPDLSARQLGVFLTCYLSDTPQTVRGLAAQLKVAKPAITRALDRLEELDLTGRKRDQNDRRSVLVQRTMNGNAFLRGIRSVWPRRTRRAVLRFRRQHRGRPPRGKRAAD